MKKLNKLTRIGLIIFIVGSGPLLLVMLFSKIGLLQDTNPNPILFGIMAMVTFWPSILLILIGVIKQFIVKPKS